MKLQIDDLGNVGILIEDWDINHEFKPRTLTCDYSTWIAYISRKAVPAGIPITDNTYWKPIGRLSKDLAFDYNNFKDNVNNNLNNQLKTIIAYQNRLVELKAVMDSFLANAEGGVPFSNMFGNSENIGVSQRTLTNVIRSIYIMVQQVTGQQMFDVTINISPDSWITGEEGKANITVATTFAIIDYVKVYFNNRLVLQEESIEGFARSLPIDDTTKVKVKTMVLGQVYTETKTIRKVSNFFVGAGQSFEDVYKIEWAREYDGNPQGQYIVPITQGQKIIIIIPTTEASKIEQIEMNDFNIPMEISTYGSYTIYTSLNVYQAGNYVIDINY